MPAHSVDNACQIRACTPCRQCMLNACLHATSGAVRGGRQVAAECSYRERSLCGHGGGGARVEPGDAGPLPHSCS